jgi:predicted nucleotidyltransferase
MSIQQKQIEKIMKVAREFGVTRLIIFGSATESDDARDIDLACDGIKGWNFFKFAAKVEEELGVQTDVISLKPATNFTRYIESKGEILL